MHILEFKDILHNKDINIHGMYFSECKDVLSICQQFTGGGGGGGLQIENMLGPEKVSFLQRQLFLDLKMYLAQ